MIRVVLDTNILVSALLSPEGPPALLFRTALLGQENRLCVSGEVYAEYDEVIRRPNLRRSESQIAATLRSIREMGIWVKPHEKVSGCLDPDDNIFLECAQAADADFLVTGNVKHFPAIWKNTRIVTVRQFLNEFG
jgi:putative PIN family toxin of toxin-antitoxin system